MGAAKIETTFPESTSTSKKLKLKIFTKKPITNPNEFSKQVPMKCTEASPPTNHHNTTVSTLNMSHSILASKRKLEGGVEYERDKKMKLDCGATSKCISILRRLMEHKFSGIFSDPVDPYKLGIPDYFEIIKKPMDLGTIKRKLERNMYMQVEEFESDVRLTFSNAMRYNPPSNWVHGAAKELMRRFDNLWKPVKAKICRQNEDSKPLSTHESIIGTTHDDMSTHFRSLHSPVGQMVPESIKKASLENVERKDVKVEKDGKAKGDKSSSTNYRGVPQMCEERACTVPSGKVIHKNVVPGKKVPHVELKCVDVKTTASSQLSRPDPELDGVDNVLDAQLSPSKALRAAMLKSRFADTILKAQQMTLLQPGDGTDPAKLKQEKERLESIQHKEKARLEAQIKAAESAARCRAESELKRKRERDRQAARMALEKMERSVDLDDNFHILRELEAIIGSSPLFLSLPRQGGISRAKFDPFENGKLRSPLERLGLFIKAEYMVGDDDEDSLQKEEDLEEGEVVF